MEEYQAKYIELAKHAIGLDYKKPYRRHGRLFYRPYRNYFATHSDTSDFRNWKTIESAGYAKSNVTEQGNHIFWLTRSGLDWLGENIGVHIYDESD